MSRGPKRMGAPRLIAAARLLALMPLAAVISCTAAEQQSTTAPSSSRCSVSLANSVETSPAAGGSGTLSIDLTRDCAWTASSGAGWVVITSASSGQGSASMTYRVAANTETAPRRTTIDVNNVQATINQEAACRYRVAPLDAAVDAAGGTVTVHVETGGACDWTAATDVGWIRLNAGATGKGNGAVTLAVDAHSGAPRSGTIRVAGQTVTVTQAAVACTYQITPTSGTISAAGGNATVTMSAGGHCPWTAASNVPWITIASGGTGTGAGSVQLTIATNPGAARTGTTTIGTQTFTLTQAAAPCTYQITPTSGTISAAGGSATVTMSAGGHCPWTAAANVPWITIASGGTGTGAGSVQLTIATNPEAARTGTTTIGTQTFTLTQAAAPCTFTVSPATIDVPLAGGERTTNVTTRVDCAWTAAANVPWITVTAGASATGSGTVRFNVAANDGDARSGAVAIGGQTLTVRQEAAPCTFAFSTHSQTYDAAGGYGAVGIATRSTCSWTAVASSIGGWLVITDRGAGTGNGVVNFSVAVNAGPERTGSLTVGAQTFWVIQRAP